MISVIIPNKKGRKIRTNLDSQTLRDFELIIIEDKELRGQSWALNRGIDKAKGEYYMFLDDDLVLEPTLLEDLYNALQSEHSIAYCNFDRRGCVTGVHKSGEWDVEKLKKNNYISNCSMVRAKDFTRWDESIHRLKDWDAWLTMAEGGKIGVFVNKKLFTVYYSDDSISVGGGFAEAHALVSKKHNL